jgi:hypothetical protein
LLSFSNFSPTKILPTKILPALAFMAASPCPCAVYFYSADSGGIFNATPTKGEYFSPISREEYSPLFVWGERT